MFWQIYCPVFAALVSAFGVTELFHIGIGYYVHRKQTKLREEFEAKVASGEINPMEMMFGGGMPGMGGPGMMDIPQLPTASGNGANGVDVSHGQYL
jgi:hypothetical protein